jgi:GDP-D-mannose 3',5'-epimerase
VGPIGDEAGGSADKLGGSVLNTDEQILVAGAGGFIGGHLVRYLTRQGFTRIRAVDIKPVSSWCQVPQQGESRQLDVSSPAIAKVAVAGCRHVFNLAAETGGAGFATAGSAPFRLSATINAALLLAASDAGATRYLYASSARAHPHELFGERLCRQFLEDFGLQTRIARYPNVYGPHCHWQGGREKAPAALCRKVAEATRAGADEIEIWGDGKQARDFIHVDDCVRASIMIMEGDVAGPVTVATGNDVSVDQLADVIEDCAGVRFKRRYNRSRPSGPRGSEDDDLLIGAVYGWEPEITLRAGLAETYRWVFEQVSARTLTGRRGLPAGSGALACRVRLDSPGHTVSRGGPRHRTAATRHRSSGGRALEAEVACTPVQTGHSRRLRGNAEHAWFPAVDGWFIGPRSLAQPAGPRHCG